jgi:hypothetical protein
MQGVSVSSIVDGNPAIAVSIAEMISLFSWLN